MNPNPIRTDTNDFANDTFANRLPKLLQNLQYKYYKTIDIKTNAALDELYRQLTNNTELPPPPLTAPDAQTWLEALEEHKGATWQGAEFLFAETYFFHLVNETMHYWQTHQDHFEWLKTEEMMEPRTKKQLDLSQSLQGSSAEKLPTLIEFALWGNRVDLSLPDLMKNQTQLVSNEDLLVDERSQALDRLLNGRGTVHIINDNFGTELAMDLALADVLLELAIPVTFHVKMYPTYVSDAIATDVLDWMIASYCSQNIPFALRLRDAWKDQRFQIAPNFFWNSPYFLNRLPSHLMKLFADASLLIFKGDVNYRRAFFDTIWPVDMPAAEIVNYLPAPALFLRTVKSDCLAGVPRALADIAQATNPNWRRLGKYGLIQYVRPVTERK